jgi:hypothetical protein
MIAGSYVQNPATNGSKMKQAKQVTQTTICKHIKIECNEPFFFRVYCKVTISAGEVEYGLFILSAVYSVVLELVDLSDCSHSNRHKH